jgi:D-alanine-D-alanine ligase
MGNIRKKVCVLKGGDSSERKISLVTGGEYAKALDALGYECCSFDFTGDVHELISHLESENPDCVLNGLHGGSGENGNIPAILNLMKIPYSHSGVLASSTAMNKQIAKQLFAAGGLQVPRGFVTGWNEFRRNPSMVYPFVVKPIAEGSSIGVHLVHNSEMLSCIDEEYKNDEVLVEEYIPGMELAVSVIDNRSIEVTNITVPEGFYDYRNKYSSGCSFHEIPAKIPEKIRKMALEHALTAHLILGCRGISRSDFRYDAMAGQLYILELNTHPGMTPVSLVPEQANFIGISFNQLVQWIVEKSCYDM